MAFARIAVVVAVLIAAGGCTAGNTGADAALPVPPVAWSRPANQAPWWMSGASPTAISIEYSLYEDVHEMDLVRKCPFRILKCDGSDAGRLEVDEVECAQVEQYQDRCTFHLTETVPGRRAVRSRCTGLFGIVGTSHDPSRWAVEYGDDEVEDPPLVTCRRTR